MRAESFLCLGSVEITNHARVAAYVNNVGVPNSEMPRACACPQLDEGFDTPLTDPAPWYEPTRPESADFLGFYASNIDLGAVMSRNVGSMRNGSVVGRLQTKGRIVTVAGLMLAKSAEGMSYGDRWLTEVLRGSPCSDGDCVSDSLTLLPACPEEPYYDSDRYFRSLVNVGVVDGPVYTPIQNLPDHFVQQGAFVLTSTQPYLFHPALTPIDQQDSTVGLNCTLATPEWMGDGTFVIDIANIDTVDTTNIVITGRISLDGGCPVTGLGASVPPSYVYTIPTLLPGDRILIDGARRQALYYDASCKSSSSALPYITFDGPWKWPDVGPCTTMCLTISSSGGETATTVNTHLREL